MNYRHAFHAGNHADVLKHLVLSRIFALLSRKEARSPTSTATPASALRPGRRPGQPHRRVAAGHRPHLAGRNPPGAARRLPRRDPLAQPGRRAALLPGLAGTGAAADPRAGSAAAQREASRGWRPAQDNMSGDRRVAVHRGEGWHVPRALMPTREKRVVLLIDPPFEQADELSRCVTALKEALGRMRQTIGVIWYPIRTSASSNALSGPRPQRPETAACRTVRPSRRRRQPPGRLGPGHRQPAVGLEDELRELLPWLAEQLAQSQGGWRLDWLIEEA